MKKTGSTTRSEPLRVLVIDDDTRLSEAILDALGTRGVFAWAVRPTASTAASEVAETAVAFRPDVVLLDIVMPVDTARLAAALRERPELEKTVFLGCSGHSALAEDISRHLDGFLHKPFDTVELLTAISEASRIRAASRKPPVSSKKKPKKSARPTRGPSRH